MHCARDLFTHFINTSFTASFTSDQLWTKVALPTLDCKIHNSSHHIYVREPCLEAHNAQEGIVGITEVCRRVGTGRSLESWSVNRHSLITDTRRHTDQQTEGHAKTNTQKHTHTDTHAHTKRHPQISTCTDRANSIHRLNVQRSLLQSGRESPGGLWVNKALLFENTPPVATRDQTQLVTLNLISRLWFLYLCKYLYILYLSIFHFSMYLCARGPWLEIKLKFWH